jgi:hypothetical protein
VRERVETLKKAVEEEKVKAVRLDEVMALKKAVQEAKGEQDVLLRALALALYRSGAAQ